MAELRPGRAGADAGAGAGAGAGADVDAGVGAGAGAGAGTPAPAESPRSARPAEHPPPAPLRRTPRLPLSPRRES